MPSSSQPVLHERRDLINTVPGTRDLLLASLRTGMYRYSATYTSHSMVSYLVLLSEKNKDVSRYRTGSRSKQRPLPGIVGQMKSRVYFLLFQYYKVPTDVDVPQLYLATGS